MRLRIVFLLIGILLFTPARGGLLVIMPILPLLLYKVQHYKVDTTKFGWLIILFVLSSIVGLLRDTTDIENVLLSAWLLLPILYLFFAEPYVSNRKNTFEGYYKATQFILIIIDIIGFSVWIRQGGDEMGTAYGRHYEYVHGLAMVNAMYLFYYVAKVRKKKFQKKHIFPFAIFALSFIFCDFGLGLLTIFATIVVMLFLERQFKYLIALGVLLIAAIIVYNSNAFDYNRENIDSALYDQDNARKVIMFYNSAHLLSKEPGIAIFGTGPGGYNSRTTALLSGNSKNVFTDLLGIHRPKYYKKDIWPLWNNILVSFDEHTDGTRNKPYSSFVALFVEYGFLFSMIIVYSAYKKIKITYKKREKSVLDYYILYIDIFMFIACIVHEWMVCTEFIVYLLLRFFASKQIKIDETKASIPVR